MLDPPQSRQSTVPPGCRTVLVLEMKKPQAHIICQWISLEWCCVFVHVCVINLDLSPSGCFHGYQ